jgi:hypothetical protein
MNKKWMSVLLLACAAVSYGDVVNPIQLGAAPLPVKIDIKKRIPVVLQTVSELRSYAAQKDYYYSVNLKEGMRVLYSASYGVGGEAGQAHGTIVQKDGKFWFKQKGNPTGQLLLPPGMTFNSSADHSLWDIGEYLELVNRVAFSDPNQVSKTANDVYGRPDAATVDFEGGTAGSTVTYTDALEVVFKKQVASRSDSEWKVYYARGIGPVALEFRENQTPAGTFKLYIGQ